MNKKLKGFTLIEIIVVIAIIGVLASILVPSMMGYIKKSKIEGANVTAATFHKGISSYIIDLDAAGMSIPDGMHSVSGGTCTAGSNKEINMNEFVDDVKSYFSEIEEIDGAFYIQNGACIAVSIKSKNYYGTYPAFITSKNWENYSRQLTSSADAVEKALQVNHVDSDI